MESAGIVVEYNPFHNGHLYHLHETKKQTGADVIIAVMSGNFLQRGEPAIVSKFHRTKMALKAGIDLVIELPYAFATQNANTFAKGAVQILQALGCKYIVFGSESGNIDTFKSTIDFMKNSTTIYNKYVKDFMKKGYSYPKASSLAFQQLNPDHDHLDLSQPNNILGYHYMKTIIDYEYPIEGRTILRIKSGYHDKDLSQEHISSATSIRKNIFENNQSLHEVRSSLPSFTYEELELFQQKFASFIQWENLWPFLKYKLIHSHNKDLQNLYEVEEGIENRMKDAALLAGSFKHFMELIKSKRYTWTRLQRISTHILTNTNKEEMFQASQNAQYIRILGLNQKGRDYLKQNKKKIELPIISKLSAAKIPSIKLDIRASQVYSFGLPNQNQQQLLEMEYKQPVIQFE